MRYKPTATDLLFARSIVGLIRDGGLWAVPANGMAFTVYHDKAAGRDAPSPGMVGRLVLEPGPCDDYLFANSVEVFKAVGYAVMKREPATEG